MNRKGRKLYLPHSVQRICSKSQFKKKKRKRKLGYAQWQLAKFAIQPLGGVSKEEQVSIKKRKKKTLQRALAEVDCISTGYLSLHASQMNDPSLFIHMQNYLLVRNRLRGSGSGSLSLVYIQQNQKRYAGLFPPIFGCRCAETFQLITT